MNARSVAITALVAALLTGCATTAPEEAEPSGGFVFNLLMGVTQIAVEGAFNAAFSSEEKEDHRHRSTSHHKHVAGTKSAPVSFKVSDKGKGARQ